MEEKQKKKYTGDKEKDYSGQEMKEFPQISKLLNLQSIIFNSNPIKNLQTLPSLVNLTHLSMDNTLIKNLKFAQRQPNLLYFSFRHTPFSKIKYHREMCCITFGNSLQTINNKSVKKSERNPISQTYFLKVQALLYEGWIINEINPEIVMENQHEKVQAKIDQIFSSTKSIDELKKDPKIIIVGEIPDGVYDILDQLAGSYIENSKKHRIIHEKMIRYVQRDLFAQDNHTLDKLLESESSCSQSKASDNSETHNNEPKIANDLMSIELISSSSFHPHQILGIKQQNSDDSPTKANKIDMRSEGKYEDVEGNSDNESFVEIEKEYESDSESDDNDQVKAPRLVLNDDFFNNKEEFFLNPSKQTSPKKSKGSLKKPKTPQIKLGTTPITDSSQKSSTDSLQKEKSSSKQSAKKNNSSSDNGSSENSKGQPLRLFVPINTLESNEIMSSDINFSSNSLMNTDVAVLGSDFVSREMELEEEERSEAPIKLFKEMHYLTSEETDENYHFSGDSNTGTTHEISNDSLEFEEIKQQPLRNISDDDQEPIQNTKLQIEQTEHIHNLLGSEKEHQDVGVGTQTKQNQVLKKKRKLKSRKKSKNLKNDNEECNVVSTNNEENKKDLTIDNKITPKKVLSPKKSTKKSNATPKKEPQNNENAASPKKSDKESNYDQIEGVKKTSHNSNASKKDSNDITKEDSNIEKDIDANNKEITNRKSKNSSAKTKDSTATNEAAPKKSSAKSAKESDTKKKYSTLDNNEVLSPTKSAKESDTRKKYSTLDNNKVLSPTKSAKESDTKNKESPKKDSKREIPIPIEQNEETNKASTLTTKIINSPKPQKRTLRRNSLRNIHVQPLIIEGQKESPRKRRNKGKSSTKEQTGIVGSPKSPKTKRSPKAKSVQRKSIIKKKISESTESPDISDNLDDIRSFRPSMKLSNSPSMSSGTQIEMFNQPSKASQRPPPLLIIQPFDMNVVEMEEETPNTQNNEIKIIEPNMNTNSNDEQNPQTNDQDNIKNRNPGSPRKTRQKSKKETSIRQTRIKNPKENEKGIPKNDKEVVKEESPVVKIENVDSDSEKTHTKSISASNNKSQNGEEKQGFKIQPFRDNFSVISSSYQPFLVKSKN